MRPMIPFALGEAELIDSNIPEVDHDPWSSVTSYSTNNLVIHAHKRWRAVTGSTNVEPGSDPTRWAELGPTNRFALLEEMPSTLSSRAGNIDVTVAPGRPFDTVYLVNVASVTASLQLIHPEQGVIYSDTRSLIDTSAMTDWHAYFTGEPQRRYSVGWQDLPMLPGVRARIVLTEGAGTASIGCLLVGRSRGLGVTQFGTEMGLQSFSRVTVDPTGHTSIQRRNYKLTRRFTVSIPVAQVNLVESAITRYRDRPVLWLGPSHRPDIGAYGLLRDWKLVVRGPAINEYVFEVHTLAFNEPETLFQGGAVAMPVITWPAEGFAHPEGGAFHLAPFAVTPADSDTHASTTWQWSLTNDFAVLAHEEPADEVNLTSISLAPGDLEVGEDYWMRVKVNGTLYGDSAFSAPRKMTAGPALDTVQPSITSPSEDEVFARNRLITSSAFATDPAFSDEHARTIWRFATDEAMTNVVATVDSTTHLTSVPVPAELLTGSDYYVDCQHVGAYNIPSTPSDAVPFTLGMPRGQREWTAPGIHRFIVPPGVTQISGVGVGGGGAGVSRNQTLDPLFIGFSAVGGGGGLVYFTLNVTPGEAFDVYVPTSAAPGSTYVPGDSATHGGPAVIRRLATGTNIARALGGQNPRWASGRLLGGLGGTWELAAGVSGGGGVGGSGGNDSSSSGWFVAGHRYGAGGGGGAGGYGGAGGNGGNVDSAASGAYALGAPGVNGGGGGGAASARAFDLATQTFLPGEAVKYGGGGGGVGLKGRGANGNGGTSDSPAGKGGSAGADGVAAIAANNGGLFGGGGMHGGHGGVRIVWGPGRAYPTSNLEDV